MADVKSVTARKKKIEERRTNGKMKIYMVCHITYGDHKKCNIVVIFRCPISF